jgi:hypothetical protein
MDQNGGIRTRWIADLPVGRPFRRAISLWTDRSICFPAEGVAAPKPTWRWFWPILGAAFLARLAVAFLTEIPQHPDETFQYLEQAHRLVYGYGVVPWEYVYGIRSWLIPLFISGILQVGREVGLDQPWEYIPLVESVFSLISLTLPVALYRLAQAVVSERGAIFAFLLGCFWSDFVWLAHKPMPGTLAMYALLAMSLLMVRPPSAARLSAFGFLAALVLGLRFQLVPVVGLLVGYAVVRNGSRVWPAIGTGVLGLVGVGLIDVWFWGGFMVSFLENFRLNFLNDISSIFGIQSSAYYIFGVMARTAGIAVLMIFGLLLCRRAIWPILLPVLIGILIFHIPEHKEHRFIIWVFPFLMLGLAAFYESQFIQKRRILAWGLILWTVLGGATTLVGNQSWRHVLTSWVVEPVPNSNDLAAVTRILARDATVTGLEFAASQTNWWQTGGYYALGKPVPIYYPDWDQRLPEPVRHRNVSHIVTDRGQRAPDGFFKAFEIGVFTVWVARDNRTAMGLRGYDPRAPGGAVLLEVPRNPAIKPWPALNFGTSGPSGGQLGPQPSPSPLTPPAETLRPG